MWSRLLWFTGSTLLGVSGQVYAQGRGGPQADFLVDAQFAFTSSKSKLVGSNDTGTALRYGLGAYAGSNSNLAFLLHFDRDVTNFQLNDSQVDMNWQDTRVRYHMSYFYLGAVLSRLEMKAERETVEIVDAAGSGMGFNAGTMFTVGRNGSIAFDILSVSVPNMKNSVDQTLAIKSRLDIDIGASIDLTSKLLDMTFGYKTRNLTIVTDTSYQDILTSTYVGLRMSLYF